MIQPAFSILSENLRRQVVSEFPFIRGPEPKNIFFVRNETKAFFKNQIFGQAFYSHKQRLSLIEGEGKFFKIGVLDRRFTIAKNNITGTDIRILNSICSFLEF